MIVSIIAAVADNQVIGYQNKIPWRQRKDMARFKEITIGSSTNGHCVIVGHETYKGLPEAYKPLPNRTNIVLSRNRLLQIEGATVAHSLDEALQMAKKLGDEEPMIIGGAQLYKEALERGLVDRMYITQIHGEPKGDTYFPQYDESEWHVTAKEHFPADENNQYPYTFMVLERN